MKEKNGMRLVIFYYKKKSRYKDDSLKKVILPNDILQL